MFYNCQKYSEALTFFLTNMRKVTYKKVQMQTHLTSDFKVIRAAYRRSPTSHIPQNPL